MTGGTSDDIASEISVKCDDNLMISTYICVSSDIRNDEISKLNFGNFQPRNASVYSETRLIRRGGSYRNTSIPSFSWCDLYNIMLIIPLWTTTCFERPYNSAVVLYRFHCTYQRCLLVASEVTNQTNTGRYHVPGKWAKQIRRLFLISLGYFGVGNL